MERHGVFPGPLSASMYSSQNVTRLTLRRLGLLPIRLAARFPTKVPMKRRMMSFAFGTTRRGRGRLMVRFFMNWLPHAVLTRNGIAAEVGSGSRWKTPQEASQHVLRRLGPRTLRARAGQSSGLTC
jgi:hypothetical protein